MTRRWRLVLLGAALSGALAATGCGPGSDMDGGRPDGGGSGDARDDRGQPPVPCSGDADGDSIPDALEGAGDADNDSTPNVRDTDSDNDGRSDTLEAAVGVAYRCGDPPVDSDRDGTPDFLDTDSDNNGIADAQDFVGTGEMPTDGWPAQPSDWDRDGVPDYVDPDDDGDRIPDATELGPMGALVDTDMDGTPDHRDDDADGDTIRDADETERDQDGDMVGNWRDDDSDGDGILDRDEAGDAMPTTAPAECMRELDAATLMTVRPDGLPDFRDNDSDNDGLSDREEVMAGTDRCNSDSDGDGQLDSAEVAWCRQNMRMNCAADRNITIPMTDYYLILPNGGPVVNRELEFGTNIRVADVFFMFDTTGSMSSVQQAVANTIARPMTGIVDSVRRIIPDTYFGVGHYDDFPTGSYGGGSDRAIHPLCDGPPGSRPGVAWCAASTGGSFGGGYGGIIMQPPAMAMVVQDAARAIPGGGGADGPESSVEALYQTITNEGLYDRSSPTACAGAVGAAPCWVKPTVCPEGTWGYPCFRDGALAVVVHYADNPYHNGARDISPATTAYYSPYTGISPTPHNFDQMLLAYQRRSARQINVAANSRCEGRGAGATARGSLGVCYDMQLSAEGTGSVDLDGNTLVYDITASTDTTTLASVVSNAINTLATRVPLDITTSTRNDPMNPAMVDARRFIQRRVPSCQVPPTNTNCWTEPTGVPHRAAVARTDLSTFYRVVPGTRVRFTIYFQNNGVYPGSEQGATLFHAFIDVLGDGVTRLDTREVFILVPARTPDIG